jgi:glycosyltransferase involved in cell wall biosynthesis
LFSSVPVITSRGGCFNEAGGPLSSYIDAMDYLELAKEIKNILEDNALRKHMQTEGLSYATKFRDEYVAARTLQLYKNVLTV